MSSENTSPRCIKCGKPATTKIVKIIKGKAVDLYLCDEHAEAASPHVQKPSLASKSNLVDIIQHFLKQQGFPGGAEQGSVDARTCPCCGLAFSAYRKTLLLGCSQCYDAFEQDLLGDLRKMHGVTSHDPGYDESGDNAPPPPVPGGDESDAPPEPTQAEKDEASSSTFVPFTEDPSTQVMQLNEAAAPIEKHGNVLSLEEMQQKMKEAIEEEDFEQAARIRDSIRLLKSVSPDTDLECERCHAPMVKFLLDNTGLYQVCSRYPMCSNMQRLDIQPEDKTAGGAKPPTESGETQKSEE